MKYEKQLRWLAFLLIPFVIILSILVIIPLTFVLDSYPTLLSNYQAQTFSSEQLAIRSLTLSYQTTFSNFLQGFTSSQQILFNLFLNNSFTFLEINDSSIVLNNAYNFSKKIIEQSQNLSTTQNLAMWFSPGVDQTAQLSSFLQQTLQQYKQINPFIEQILFGRNNNFVYSLSFYIVSNSSSPIYIQYPSRYQSRFQNFNAEVQDQFYSITMSYNSENVVSFLDYSQTQDITLLALCRSGSLGSFNAVSCLRLDLSVIGQYFGQNVISNWEGELSMLTYLVLSNDLGGLTSPYPQILLSFSSQYQNNFTAPQNQYFNGLNFGINPSVFSSTPNDLNKNLYIMQKNLTSSFVVPISVVTQDSQLIGIHLITEQIYEDSIFTNSFISQNIRTLLIPIIILIGVTAIGTAYILKILFNSIDYELFQLDKRSKFIADGDINIDIPNYEGTKDIKQVYDQVRIINKLHRYSTQSYFTGHFSEKILKYTEALQFIRNLNYDPGNLLENMGEAYTNIEEWQKAREALKQSVELAMDQIQNQGFKSLDLMMPLKAAKKVPHRYKELQVILIRRLFKLNVVFVKYLEFRPTFTKKDEDENLQQKVFLKKKEEILQESTFYLAMQKKIYFPDYSGFSECIVMLIYESKLFANMNNFKEANVLLQNASKCLEKYTAEYANTTKLLKEKGSKHKFLHTKNKLTAHSRTHPEIINMIKNLFKSKILLAQSKSPVRYIHALNLLCTGIRVSVFTLSIMYLSILEIRKIFLDLKFDLSKFETTQLFRQVLPFKALHFGEITKEVQAQLMKFPTKTSLGLQRQFSLVFDCGRDYKKDDGRLMEYQAERISYIYEKLIKKNDRVSVLKSNTKVGVQVECGLLFKESNYAILKKAIDEAVRQRNNFRVKENSLIESLRRAFCRIQNLKSQKIIIIFVRGIDQDRQRLKRIRKRKQKQENENRYNIKNETKILQDYTSSLQEQILQTLGPCIVDLFQQEGIRNVKLILYCGQNDSIENFNEYFDLKDINKRIWRKEGGLNVWNNLVYVIEQKHKGDIDRILMLKTQDVPDNNVFVL